MPRSVNVRLHQLVTSSKKLYDEYVCVLWYIYELIATQRTALLSRFMRWIAVESFGLRIWSRTKFCYIYFG